MIRREILQQYETLSPSLRPAYSELKAFLKELLRDPALKIHSVSGRVKTPEGLQQKIARPERTYTDLWDITDLAGFRVITYFEDSIQHVARTIEKALDVDFANSVNKLKSDDHQKFGYRSLHYVCKWPDLPNRPVPNARFEIQIRTVLQHAWAEIEHDIGYKATEEIPGLFRRRFSQVASLLEVADREFVAIREGLLAYEESVTSAGPQASDDLPLDQITLRSFLETPAVTKLDAVVSGSLGPHVGNDDFYPDYLLKVLHAAELRSVKAVHDAVSTHGSKLEGFLKPYFEFARGAWNFDAARIESIQRGYGLHFIAHLSVLDRDPLLIDKLNRVSRFYRDIDYPEDSEKAAVVGRQLIEKLKSHGALFL